MEDMEAVKDRGERVLFIAEKYAHAESVFLTRHKIVAIIIMNHDEKRPPRYCPRGVLFFLDIHTLRGV